MTTALTERLVTRLAAFGTGGGSRRASVRSSRRPSRRGFLAAATLTGAALAVDPWGYLTRPQSAYAATCGTDASCSSGYSAFCCSINHGHNTCPPNTYPGGWWKADRSSFCGGAARYYIDCNAKPGHHFRCHCNQTNCDHRYVACNIFRYGQCNTQVHGITAVVCRQVSCLPPWELHPGSCGHSSATDNNTRGQTAPCLTKANSNPNLVSFAAGPHYLSAGHFLLPGHRLVADNRHTECVMQADGNLVIRNQHGVVWTSGTSGVARGGRLQLLPDGRLALLDKHGTVRWSTHPSSPAPVSLWMRDDGQLAVLHHTTVVWHTNTHTP